VADGSIIATIMTAHMRNMKANSAPLQGWSLDVITILLPAETIRVPVMSMPATCTLVASRPT
jgi:hypothetical protein